MHKIDHAKLAATIARNVSRGDFVLQDPPVSKAGRQALRDVRQAAKSTGHFVTEVRSSWARSASI